MAGQNRSLSCALVRWLKRDEGPPSTCNSPDRHYRNSDRTFLTVASLPRASAVKMPSAANAAQTSRAVWKLLTNVCCSAWILVRERFCACGEQPGRFPLSITRGRPHHCTCIGRLEKPLTNANNGETPDDIPGSTLRV